MIFRKKFYLHSDGIYSNQTEYLDFFFVSGVLIYEMLAGFPPFYDDNPFGIYEKILGGKIEWPKHLDPVAKDLIKKLLVQDRTKRLGNMKVNEENNVLKSSALIKI